MSAAERAFAELLREVLDESGNDAQAFRRIETFEEAGILTLNAGLVVELTDGTEYQITIVRSRP